MPNASELLLVGRVVRRQDDLRFAPLVACCLDHFSEERRSDVCAILLQDSAQERHSPGGSIDAVIGWRLVKQAKNGPPQILVVDFAVRLALRGKHKFGTLASEHVPIFTDKGLADAEKCANRPTWNFSAACYGYHSAVAIRQAAVVEVLKQNGKVWNIAQLVMESVLI